MSFNYTQKDIQKLQKAKAKAKEKHDLKDVANCCNVLGELYQQLGKYEDAISEHKEERKVCKELNDQLGIGIAHRKIGEALNELGRYEEALQHQDKYLSLAKSIDNKLEIQRALATIGRTHFCYAEALTTNNRLLYDGALANSQDAYLKSLEICEVIKDALPEKDYMMMNSRLYLNLGLVSDLQLQDNPAINYFKKAIYIASKYGFKEDLHRCHYSLSLFYQRRKNYSQAKREVEMAEKVAFQLKDKAMICDDLTLKAQLFVIMADYESARRYLLKAYRQKTPIAQDRDKIEADLRSAIRLCKLQDQCCKLDSNDIEKLMKLHEKMGDLCSSLKAYSKALDFYKKILNKAQELSWSPKQIIPIYVSLSQTYMDLKDYKNAIVYYKKELEQYGDNPSEACRTILNIANALEEDGATYYELEPLYTQAIKLANEANNPKLKATAFNSLAVLQEANGFPEKSQETMTTVHKICADYGIDLDDDSEESPSQVIKDEWTDDEIDMQELLEEESDEEEIGSSRGKRYPKRNVEKLNMKGETALHRACIKQDSSLVKMLLQQKHKVNVRDNCGWTPLHEACNYGNIDIVRMLIEHGAAVNDRGGKYCEGITPLHDAASCGHIEVMDVLLQYGANPLAQTDAGESVYECLLKWRLRTGGDLDPRSLSQCVEMEERIKQAMNKANQRVPSIKEVEHRRTSTCALIPEEEMPIVPSVPTKDLDNDNDDTTPRLAIKNPTHRREASTSAQREYEHAIKVIGSSSMRRSSVPMPSKRIRQIPALLPENEIEEDWLEDDLTSPTRKPAKRSNPTLQPHKSANPCESARDKPIISLSPAHNQKRDKSKLSLSNRSKLDSPGLFSRDPSASDDDFDQIEIFTSAKRSRSSSHFSDLNDDSCERPSSPILSFTKKTKKPVQLSIDSFTDVYPKSPTTTKSSERPTQLSSQAAILKLYVRIQDKLLLIPVDCNKSVCWLIEEAARRYNSMTGLNPILSLQTLEGAALNENDIVGMILKDGDKVVGQMLKWDLQPLNERYGNLCRQLERTRLGEIDTMLSNAHACGKLIFHLPLGWQILPVLKALRYQDSLWNLDMSLSKLDDQLFQNLCEALSTLSNLTSLDLHGNLITAAGISRLAEMLQSETGQTLQKLVSLDLSFNPLGDGAMHHLAICLQKLPLARQLSLEGCDLTDCSLDNNFSTVLKTKSLTDIGIGWNSFHYKLKPWLEVLDFDRLERICLRGLPKTRPVNALCTRLQTKEKSRLSELDLSNCNLTDACLRLLSEVVNKFPNLKRLIFRNNTKLHTSSVECVLDACRLNCIYVEEVDFSGCALSNNSPVIPNDVIRALRSFLNWSRCLHRLSLTLSSRNADTRWISSLVDAWQVGHKGDGRIQEVTERYLIFSTSSS